MKTIDLLMKFTKPIIKSIYRVVLSVVFVGAVLLAGLFIYDPYFLAEDACLDSGQVWDASEKRCREDCLKWNEDYGCIKLTSDQVAALAQCQHKTNCFSKKVYKEICLNNQKAWDIIKESCWFEFKAADCGKSAGRWEYPEICTAQKTNP